MMPPNLGLKVATKLDKKNEDELELFGNGHAFVLGRRGIYSGNKLSRMVKRTQTRG